MVVTTVIAGFKIVRVIGIGADWCGKCIDAKAYLRRHHIYIEWLDIDTDIEAQALMEKYQQNNIPFFVIDIPNPVFTFQHTFKYVTELRKHIEEIQSKQEDSGESS